MKKLLYFLLPLASVLVMHGCSDDQPVTPPISFGTNADVSGAAGDEIKLNTVNFVANYDNMEFVINGKAFTEVSRSGDATNTGEGVVYLKIPFKAGSGTIQIKTKDGRTIDGPKLTYIPQYFTEGMGGPSDIGLSLAQHNAGAMTWDYEAKALYTLTAKGMEINTNNTIDLPVVFTKTVLTLPDAANATANLLQMGGMAVTDDNHVLFANIYQGTAATGFVNMPQIMLAMPEERLDATYATGGSPRTDLGTYVTSIATDHGGENIYYAQAENTAISKLGSFGTAKPVVVAGSANTGHVDGQGAAAKFENITGLVYDKAAGKLYVADQHCIREVTADGKVTTLAGSTVSGDADGSLAEARFKDIGALALAEDGKLYVADNGNQKVKVIDKGRTTVSTLRGATSASASDKSHQFTVDKNGVIYGLSVGTNYGTYFSISLPESMVGEKEYARMEALKKISMGGDQTVVLKAK